MSKKQNRVVRLTEDILSKPQLISKPAFNTIMQYLRKRNDGVLFKMDFGDVPDDDSNPEDTDGEYDVTMSLGVLDISGSLSNMPIQTMCGEIGTSYQAILSQADEMLDAGIKNIVMNIDSGGGEAFNCFQAANQLRAMCDASGATLTTYVQSCAASAAYAWAVVADEIICHPQGEVGSVGVLVHLQNDSKMMQEMGIEDTYISAGENKIPFAADGSFTPSFIEGLQAKVDDLYTQFVAHVSTYTGLSAQDIIDTKADTFTGPIALAKGMVNKIMDNQQFADYMTAKIQGASNA